MGRKEVACEFAMLGLIGKASNESNENKKTGKKAEEYWGRKMLDKRRNASCHLVRETTVKGQGAFDFSFSGA